MKSLTVCMSLISLLLSCANASESPSYSPGLGEIMGVIQQHHAKLFYAGSAGNWDLAAYELDELKEGLEDAAKAHHDFKNLKTPLQELVPAMTKPAVEGVSAAISAKNRASFLKGFVSLTRSCNQCHETAEHPFIVIQTPSRPEFTNQKFTP